MSWLLSNSERPYIDSAKTDVMKAWRKFGFVPPSENKPLDGFYGTSVGLPMANTSEADREAKNGLKIDSNEREAV